MKEITLQQLATALDGNYWEAGDKKRVYLERGYNKKKMTTKTFIYEKENGTFGVSVYIECPSQNYNWIESQKSKIMQEVEEEINWIVQEKVLIIEVNGSYLDWDGKEASLEEAEKFLNEKDVLNFIKEKGVNNYSIITINNELEIA